MWIVTLDGNSTVFAADTVSTISYSGGSQGGDTFNNNTGLNEVTVMYGGSTKSSAAPDLTSPTSGATITPSIPRVEPARCSPTAPTTTSTPRMPP